MIRRTANMTHAVVAKPVSKLAGYLAGSIIGEQSRFHLNSSRWDEQNSPLNHCHICSIGVDGVQCRS